MLLWEQEELVELLPGVLGLMVEILALMGQVIS